MLYLSNAFSLSMLESVPVAAARVNKYSADLTMPVRLEIVEIATSDLAALIERCGGYTSVVGHADTAALFATLLGQPVECNRVSVQISPGRSLLVGQYAGPRLPEGATSLPAGASVRWLFVRYA